MSIPSKFGVLKDLYPAHYRAFLNVIKRSSDVGTDLTNDKNGYLEFVEELGPCPPDMKQPTVGRKDHSLGYVRGNYFWQSSSENYSEVRSRTPNGMLGKSHSSESRKLNSDSQRRRLLLV